MAGVNRQDFDDILKAVARRTKQDVEIDDLGKALKIPSYDIQSAQKRNSQDHSHMGSLELLRDWMQRQNSSTMRQTLIDALVKIKRNDILEECFPEDGADTVTEPTKKKPASRTSGLLTGRMTNLMEMKLNKIGDAVGDDENLAALGLRLGFQQSKVNLFLATNRVDGKVSSKGTKNMLSAWSKKTPGKDQVRELSDALADVELGHIAEEYLQ
ncbi:uncharacterized protein LOC105445398 isoform X2 [Strongylocentrotus purpuratus]|uniref:Death domain-containing protein n=1 Tax=Strongylocentrotus purpuratus TaxID=7668 RepID=A0A7M7NC72_STRPU|nr:uncharacterized protein LOC105445398 isoform X2 [Strongylocentrotus purpuratus]